VLRSGSIHLRLLNGVDLAITGPARFVIHSPFELDLEQGICRAAVPVTGHGFTINTAEMEVIDLSTEFWVSVDPKGRVFEVRVFEGEVDVIAANSTKKTRLEMYGTLPLPTRMAGDRAPFTCRPPAGRDQKFMDRFAGAIGKNLFARIPVEP
jgi:hypothetical protein